ncbi:MAG: spore germination protein [Cognaticolwellia sp.]|jgi:spore germination protein
MILLLSMPLLAGTPQPGVPQPFSVHAAHRAKPPSIASLTQTQHSPPLAPDSASAWVYGYYAAWAGELEDLQWQHLTHVAIFAVDLNSDGSLDDTKVWNDLAPTAMELAAPHGVHVHLTLTCFDDQVMTSVLANPSTRAAAVSNLGALVDAHGAHGVSVDCEGMPSSLKPHLVSFVGELKERVGEVTVATPAVDWSGAYDYDELAANSDALFIMGYGYHWSGGDPGPGAPLEGGGDFSKYSLAWSVQDYLDAGTPRDKIILGLPLYGRDWPSTDTSIPGTATDNGSAVTYSVAQRDYLGMDGGYDGLAEAPYYFPTSTRQAWVDNRDSLYPKMAYAVDQELLGFGFWALNYEGGDPDFWANVALLAVEIQDPVDSVDSGDTSPGRGNVSGTPLTPSGCGCTTQKRPGSTGLLPGALLLIVAIRRRGNRS